MAKKSTVTSSPVKTVRVPRKRSRGRTLWLIAAGLVAGIAGGVFAVRMLVPPGEPEPVRDLEPQPSETLPREEPVEISTRMRPGEWTEESLQAHVEDYRHRIREMGARESQIVTNVERTESGAARVVVSWDRTRD
ncbi:hypothetical protein [Paenarthrobacter sp. JL.01a]|uniref:hypothetical protein n=1 Tax=Paenarthrobacter sp. JL.01a TaxID=2979324 RepID=UPI0021C5EA70|nr:hypothetical protein [Paenarthrobacter sp. JL.01a]UXM91188.1 hypothetical protein N5P29_18100 [Paenarthrobacter sp. JL.01a]